MISFREEKIENAICYFAYKHIEKTGKPLWQTLLYKYLSFLDLISIKETGTPSLELAYLAFPKGPVPLEIQSKRENYVTGCFSFINTSGNYYKIKAHKEANLKYFSEYEINLMNKTLEKYSIKGLTNKQMIDKAVEDSHNLRAWIVAFNRNKNKGKKIKYEEMFENLNTKTEKELLPAEENFLVYNILDQKSKCW